ncbi:MAG: cytochrome c biogenesis protein DipZ [Actinomycetota bacterium]|nr:cytochrome c biogenesis protein DipZ [Actinomycetota bacterium]
MITAISPCVFPVLPIVLAGGASGGRRRPYAIIAGLVVSFSLSILFVAWALDKLGLPQDLLRDIAIALLFVVAATLIVPQLARLLERPLLFLTRRRAGDSGSGFVLGLSLGLVFVPCGGPVLGYVSAQAATLHFGLKPVLLTVAYALGAAVPLLAIAIGGRNALGLGFVRAHQREVRAGLGVVMAAAALLIVFNVDRKLQTKVGDYTAFLQRHTEDSCYAKRKLNDGCRDRLAAASSDYGPAADFVGIDAWLNSKPLSIRDLRGKVVLVDFWTYSCINCLRTLPHLKAWYANYHGAGLEIVGVHTPEFGFEHVLSNVRKAVGDLGIRYPVALDNGYSTWGAYRNNAWPTEYLVDRRGRIQELKAGEGDYDGTERKIRELLGERAPAELAPQPDLTPREAATPETYLGYARLDRFVGGRLLPDVPYRYTVPPAIPQHTLAYGGTWTVGKERILAGPGARLALHFVARNVYLVAGGRGAIGVLVNGKRVQTIRVSGISRLYTVLSYPQVRDALLELRFSPGLSGYSFTFG